MSARAIGSPAATQRSQNPDTISTSDVPARPASVSHADNSAKKASFMSRLYSHDVRLSHKREVLRRPQNTDPRVGGGAIECDGKKSPATHLFDSPLSLLSGAPLSVNSG